MCSSGVFKLVYKGSYANSQCIWRDELCNSRLSQWKVWLTLALISIAQIPELSNTSVCMRDPKKVQETLESMVKAGSNTVQVHSIHNMIQGAFHGHHEYSFILLIRVSHPGDLRFWHDPNEICLQWKKVSYLPQ